MSSFIEMELSTSRAQVEVLMRKDFDHASLEAEMDAARVGLASETELK